MFDYQSTRLTVRDNWNILLWCGDSDRISRSGCSCRTPSPLVSKAHRQNRDDFSRCRQVGCPAPPVRFVWTLRISESHGSIEFDRDILAAPIRARRIVRNGQTSWRRRIPTPRKERRPIGLRRPHLLPRPSRAFRRGIRSPIGPQRGVISSLQQGMSGLSCDFLPAFRMAMDGASRRPLLSLSLSLLLLLLSSTQPEQG